MTKRKKPARLSAGEMEILQILWRHGSVTLAEARGGLDREIGYTTMQTRLNRLVEKGVVLRTADRPAKYSAAIESGEVSARHLDLLLERVCEGSVIPLVAHLVRDRNLSADEIAGLKDLIAEAERQQAEAKSPKHRTNGSAQ